MSVIITMKKIITKLVQSLISAGFIYLLISFIIIFLLNYLSLFKLDPFGINELVRISLLLILNGVVVFIYSINRLIKRKFQLNTLFLIIICLGSIAIFSYLAFYDHSVMGKSMLPTFKSGQSIHCYPKLNIEQNDIIIFKHDENKVINTTNIDTPAIEELSQKNFIKRVIGIPGDKIVINERGEVYRNAKLLSEPYLFSQRSTNLWEGGFAKNGLPIVVPYNKLFVMGDNRELSSDSREFGFVSIDDISCVIPWVKQDGYKNRWKTSNVKQQDSIVPRVAVDKVVITITPTTIPTPTIDINPIIECKIASECGGGTKQLSLTDCAKSSCCQIGTVWSLYYDRDKCLADQESHYNELVKLLKRYPTLNIPTLAPLPTIPPLPRYSPSYQSAPLIMPTMDIYQMYKQCFRNATDSFNARVAPLLAGGTAESSLMIEEQIRRDQDIGTCQRLYRY